MTKKLPFARVEKPSEKKYDLVMIFKKILHLLKVIFPKKKKKKSVIKEPYDKTHMSPSIENDARIDHHAIKTPHAIAGETEKMNEIHNARMHRRPASDFKRKPQNDNEKNVPRGRF